MSLGAILCYVGLHSWGKWRVIEPSLRSVRACRREQCHAMQHDPPD